MNAGTYIDAYYAILYYGKSILEIIFYIMGILVFVKCLKKNKRGTEEE